MNDMVLAALRRKQEQYERAGMAEKAARTAAQIALYEAELYPAPEPAEPVQEPKAEPPAGVVLTPAAQARADEMGLTPDDFKGQTPSGKAGEFLVSDVQRIAEAKSKPNTEGDNDGDHKLP